VSSRGPLIVFRTEGDSRLGLGHVVRSLALANRLAPVARCVFALGTQDERVLDRVRDAGCDLAPLPPEEEAEAIASLAPQAVVTDLPQGADAEALRPVAPLLVVVDDLGMDACSADIVVNGTVVPQFQVYPHRRDTQYLLGPAYMILRDEFARCNAQPRGFPQIARSVVVSMGGADQQGLAPRVLRALDAVEPLERCLVVAGPMCSTGEALRAAADESRMICRIVTDPPAMAPLLYGADLAVTCGGMTLYEAAAVGTPTIVLPQVASQLLEIEEFAQRSAAARVKSDLGRNLTRLAATARSLAVDLEHRKEMSRCARALVDGRGAQRVAAAICEALTAPVP